jgi:hypothetical protein
VVELDNAIAEVEIAVIVGDHDDGFAAHLQLWQDFEAKNLTKCRVLVRSPSIKKLNGTVLHVSGK